MFLGAYRNGAGEVEPAARSVMIESPTGSGKTCMGLLIAKALQQHEGARVGWVAMRRNLLEQVKAENNRHGINVDLQTISMFQKNPPTDIDLLVVDECVPGETMVDVLVDGQRQQARMDEVVLDGVGSSVLSYSETGELDYQPITSRSPMGRKELVEVTIDTAEGEKVLLITEEGRVWTETGYRRPLDLLGNTVLCKSSHFDTASLVQGQTPAGALVRGAFVTVRRTGRFVETYDIGVARNHNFFADGILIHNCQHDAASSCAHLHNVIKPKWILGLSATPFRTDRVKLCFDKIVKDAGIHQLIQAAYLSSFDHYTVPNWDVEQLADFYCAEPNRWGKSIFFFRSVEECFSLDKLLRNRGIMSDVVTGSSDRESQLDAFRDKNVGLQVLVNCMVLTEGFDEPSLQTVWVRPSSKGPTIQMAGRVLRKYDSTPTKQIVQCRQTRHPFAKTANPHQSYLWQCDEWRSLKVNPKLNLCNRNVQRAIAATEVELPKFLTRKSSRSRWTRNRR